MRITDGSTPTLFYNYSQRGQKGKIMYIIAIIIPETSCSTSLSVYIVTFVFVLIALAYPRPKDLFHFFNNLPNVDIPS